MMYRFGGGGDVPRVAERAKSFNDRDAHFLFSIHVLLVLNLYTFKCFKICLYLFSF